MVKFVLSAVFLLISETVAIEVPNAPKQPFFEVILDRVEAVLEKPSISTWHLKVRKVNKTRAIVGYITFYQPVGNELQMEFKTLKKQGGEYRYMPYGVGPERMCKLAASDTYVYPDFSKQSDFPEDIANHCPLAAGNYSVHGVTFSLENVPKVAAQTGEYVIEANFFKDETLIATYKVYGFVNQV